MPNILDELVRVNAFHSKSEARMMIKNGGVSIIRSFHENAIPPCFKDKSVEDNIEYLTISEEDYICYWQEAKSFLKKATFDTLEEAKAAKIEHDKTYNEIKNRDVVARVIEGAEN